MAEKEFDLSVEEQEIEAETDTVVGDISKESIFLRVRRHLPEAVVYARYVLPFVFVLFLLAFSLFFNVQFVSGGKRQELSILRLIFNSFVGLHEYLGGDPREGASAFYTLIIIGAAICVICLLLSLFFTGLAAYTAVRAFLSGPESEQSDRMKLIFKTAFPNRVCLFLSDLLIFVPIVYPHYFSFIGTRYLFFTGKDAIFILFNRPLLIAGIFSVLILVLTFACSRFERSKRMNMFVLHRSEEEGAEEEEEDEEDPEDDGES